MSTSTNQRKSWMLPAPKAPLAVAVDFLQRSDVWARVGLCALTTVILWIVMFGWAPPFSYRVRQAPLRDMTAHTTFQYDDLKATQEKKDRERRTFLCYYANDKQPVEQLQQALLDEVFKIKQMTYEELAKSKTWEKFFPAPDEKTKESKATQENLEAFRKSLEKDEKLDRLAYAVGIAFLEIEKNGLLASLEHEYGTGSMQEIQVFPKGDPQNRSRVSVSNVRIAEVSGDLRKRLALELKKESEIIEDTDTVSERVFDWLKPQLPVTLNYDAIGTSRAVDTAVNNLEIEQRLYEPGEKLEQVGKNLQLRGIKGGVPLDEEDIKLLRAEHAAQMAGETWTIRIVRSLLFFGLFASIFAMIAQYLYYRDRHLLDDLKHFAILLGLIMITLIIAWLVTLEVSWRAEIIPIMIFSILIAISYHIELAIILGALVSLAFSVAHGYGMTEFVVLTAASWSSALMCRKIRSRTKLVNLGLVVAAIVFPITIGVGYLLGQPLAAPLYTDAAWYACGAGMAGLVMTAFLPFLERLFDIQTDISLLELSDANHPLLKELVQRAPGTYNHSINVASISEAAAEAIGANGLLCRVGAYFHDVGKLRKPEYFIENQAGGVNKHDDLVPTMSTLVIIAHVKDGAEIARKHRLPQRIIDLIEQHHGTTLVEYFFKRASKIQAERNEENEEEGSDVDESDFRYPGPKPQTAEAAVLMLADTVESASRVLREPAPSRIESLVHELAKKKLEDGQLDECPITIEQLKIVQNSLTKSLNAMYHARVKYPEQQSA